MKIHRKVVINGRNTWIRANSEQDYAEKLLALSGQPPKPVGNTKFRDYADRWFQVFSKPNVENITAITYRRQLDLHINPIIGDKMLEEISAANLQEIFNAMGEYAAHQTKLKVKNVLNQIFKMAVEDGIIQWNPMQSRSLRYNGLSSVATEPYSLSEMRYFVSHIDSIRDDTDRAWMALSVSLPLRPEEVLGLRWCDIDEDQMVLHVYCTVSHPTRNNPVFKPYTKTKASVRTLAISQWLVNRLPKRSYDEDFVIGGESPLSYTKLRCLRKRIARDLNYDGIITPRRFRTTVATDISATTHDLKLVQKMLGHATPQMTLKHYDKGRSTSIDATGAIEKCYGIT